jgi:HEPN domain-containing protein
MTHPRAWLRQAEADLKAARDSLAAQNEEWACYQAQQCAEKALKAYLYLKGFTSIRTDSLRELVKQCERLDSAFEALRADAKYLK